MLKNYSVTYNCRFEHDEDNYNCSAEITEHNPFFTVFKFKSDLTGDTVTKYILSGYQGTHWLINLTDQLLIFISNPLDINSTMNDLQELDDIDEDIAEELAAVVHSAESYGYIPAMSSENTPQYFFNSDDDLPF